MKKNNAVFIILGLLFFFNIFAWVVVYDLSQPRFLEVTFFDVGQGDAIFIETPQGHQILIDGGPDSTVLEKLGKEMPFWDRTIDLVILTHPEHDHFAGLLQVLKRYKIDYILWTGIIRDTNEYQEWRRLIEEEKAEIKIAKAGQKIKLTDNIYIDILHPFENLEGQESKNSNNTSIINFLVFGQHSWLFTGDAYKSVEKELIKKNTDLTADILKIGHHGSKTSTAPEFIEQISPEIAVISAGRDNRYGHPSQEVLEILESHGIRVLRTDIDGDIKIISDGMDIIIK
ncbi:MAG TPA: MBL fold metallo-hydrolase [Candidatus Nealsonbacteria bacterium]|uniref:Metallo-beta-lactamase domain-containing protein n=1 Tax=marine sediment metagenome TaxID=412755 RepID=A0A0F9X419_9ZZZZ|nr:MBL fold metallo-hydrolase [Candidatus Nealsonbacteria bacterium]HEB46817.1 MBL fold metallo-hydrolase [Candidatus Nealsonbacteria bacterium]